MGSSRNSNNSSDNSPGSSSNRNSTGSRSSRIGSSSSSSGRIARAGSSGMWVRQRWRACRQLHRFARINRDKAADIMKRRYGWVCPNVGEVISTFAINTISPIHLPCPRFQKPWWVRLPPSSSVAIILVITVLVEVVVETVLEVAVVVLVVVVVVVAAAVLVQVAVV